MNQNGNGLPGAVLDACNHGSHNGPEQDSMCAFGVTLRNLNSNKCGMRYILYKGSLAELPLYFSLYFSNLFGSGHNYLGIFVIFTTFGMFDVCVGLLVLFCGFGVEKLRFLSLSAQNHAKSFRKYL